MLLLKQMGVNRQLYPSAKNLDRGRVVIVKIALSNNERDVYYLWIIQVLELYYQVVATPF